MKSIAFLSALVFSTALFAQDGREALKSVGEVYSKTDGACSSNVDIMRWFNYDDQGIITFALTDRPGVRPLTGYSMAATTSAQDILPLGQGVFKLQPNQYVPIKSEMSYEANGDLNLFFHHKGKGSLGGIIIEAPSYSGQNHKFEFFFSAKNARGIYENLTFTYKELKGLVPKKKVVCSFVLSK